MKKISSQEPQVLLYQTDDGTTRVEVRMGGETVWLNQNQMAELFLSTTQNVGQHIRYVFAAGELAPESVVKDFFTTAADGKRYTVSYYNLSAILAVGFRVRSLRGTQFRRWATAQLEDYLVKGFVLDDERMKNPASGVYFEALLERIRDIRSSEKVFWRKVLDIYATSIDYDPSAEATQQFFASIQNKMHCAAHGQTAAEVIMQRADSSQPNMGLTSFSGLQPRRSEVAIAKNYLNVEELETLNRIVMFYLEFAELQARGRRTMTMTDWIKKLDDFLKLSAPEVLTHAGRISAEAANQKARRNEHYRQQMDALPAPVEQDMTRVLEATHKKNWLVRQEGTRQVCRETDYIERRWHKKMTAITFFCAAVSRPPQL